MLIRYTGPQIIRRIIGQYEWSRATEFVQDVTDASLAAELLTAPEGRFAVATMDPLINLDGIGEQRAAELALAGIATLADLAALDDIGIGRLDKSLWASRKQIRAWVFQARELLGAQQTAPEITQEE